MKKLALVLLSIFFLLAAVVAFGFPLNNNSKPAQAQGAACSGEISVSNAKSEIEFRDTNEFTVTVKNTGDTEMTVTVVDEIWEDENCYGQADKYGCEGSKLSDPCGWGATSGGSKRWENITLTSGEEKNLTWQKKGFFPGFCYLHNVYFYSTPLDGSNACWQGFDNGWQEAQNGNLAFKKNQERFRVTSSYPLLDGTAYGGLIHLDPTKEAGVQSLERFKDDIDKLSKNSTKWRIVRLAVHPWLLVQGATPSNINWKEDSLSKVAETINYAYNNGFSVIFTTSPWDNDVAWGGGYSEQAYNDYVTRFFGELAQKFKEQGVQEKIYLWAPWNEANNWCFTNYINESECSSRGSLPPNYRSSDEYMEEFLPAFATARDAIRSVDPSAKVIPHGGYYRWYLMTEKHFRDNIDDFDGIGLSFYPGAVEHRAKRFGEILDYFRYRYNKPVYVLETGIPSVEVGEQLQANYLEKFFRYANKHATLVDLYQIDDLYEPNEPEFRGFGIRKKDGSEKIAYDPLLNFVDEQGTTLRKFDTLDFFLTNYPETVLVSSEGCGEGQDYCERHQQVQYDNSAVYIKYGNPDFYEYHTWDKNYIYLRYDNSWSEHFDGICPEGSPGGGATSYEITEFPGKGGRWMKREMAVGESLEIDQESQWYREDCKECGKHRFPYTVTLDAYYPNYDLGGDLGEQEIIVLKYSWGSESDGNYEKFWYSREWGWVKYESVKNGTLTNLKVWNTDVRNTKHPYNLVDPEEKCVALPSPPVTPTPTPTPTSTPSVTFKDVLGKWGTSSYDEDLNKDGTVNGMDFGQLIKDINP